MVMTRVQRLREVRRTRVRRAWIASAVMFGIPLLVLMWPVKSLLWYFPKWYVELLLGI